MFGFLSKKPYWDILKTYRNLEQISELKGQNGSSSKRSIFSKYMLHIEKVSSEEMESTRWNSGDDVILGGWECDQTDFDQWCYREDFLRKSKIESFWDEKMEICSMCISWQDIGDGLRFHLPDDIFTTLAPFNKGSIIEEEDEGKNYSEGEKEEVLDQISNQVDF